MFSSIISIIYLTVFFILVPKHPNKKLGKLTEDDSMFLKSLEGFIMVVSPDGDFVYLSENVSDYLGIAQVNNTELQSVIIYMY